MWYQPTVTAAASEPISLVKAKAHLTVLHDDDDDYITDLIISARDHAEKYSGARFASQTIEITADYWTDLARLPVLPITSITSIGYTDTDSAAQTLAGTVYTLRGDGIVLQLNQAWPTIEEKSLITVTAVVGFAVCPASVKHAMLIWIRDAYEMRGAEGQESFTTFDALLANSRFY